MHQESEIIEHLESWIFKENQYIVACKTQSQSSSAAPWIPDNHKLLIILKIGTDWLVLQEHEEAYFVAMSLVSEEALDQMSEEVPVLCPCAAFSLSTNPLPQTSHKHSKPHTQFLLLIPGPLPMLLLYLPSPLGSYPLHLALLQDFKDLVIDNESNKDSLNSPPTSPLELSRAAMKITTISKSYFNYKMLQFQHLMEYDGSHHRSERCPSICPILALETVMEHSIGNKSSKLPQRSSLLPKVNWVLSFLLLWTGVYNEEIHNWSPVNFIWHLQEYTDKSSTTPCMSKISPLETNWYLLETVRNSRSHFSQSLRLRF